MMRCSLVRAVGLSLGTLLLAACASPPPLPGDQFFRVEPPPAEAGARALAGTLYVPSLAVSGVYAERPLLVADLGGNRLVQRRYDFWVDEPGRMLQQVLVTALREAGLAEAVASERPARRPAATLTGEVVRFELVRDGEEFRPEVVLHFILKNADGERLLDQRFAAEGVPESFDDALGPEGFPALVGRVFAELMTASRAALADP